MPRSLSPTPSHGSEFDVSGVADQAPLSKLVYRSRAIHPLSSLELYQLTLAAQARNRAEAVTGLMLYDQESFFQWLEGPEEGVERIMRSILDDPRHTEIEILERQPVSARVFAGWSMKLAARGQAEASWRRDVMEPPAALVETLRRTPQAAPVLLATLLPTAAGVSAAVITNFVPSPQALNRQAAAVLKAVIIETVIPDLANQHGVVRIRSRALPINKRVGELADLLIGADQDAALELIQEVRAETVPSLLHYAALFEPAARRLGDLCGEGVCTEFDVTLGLSRIQSAVRLLSSGGMRRRVAAPSGPDVLIAPEPGELHGLGAALDSEVMRSVGWNPHCEYPQDDHALEDLVAATWFDVLDLSLSAAFHREHWLPRLKKTIAAARQASCNPALVVVVGGRLFADHRAVGRQVGANAANATALGVDRSIMDHLHKEG